MKEKIKRIVLESMDELNKLLDDDCRLELKEDEKLLDPEGKIDSLDFVNLIATIEDKLFEEFDSSPSIVSEKAFSRKNSPFKDVSTITEYLVRLMEGE